MHGSENKAFGRTTQLSCPGKTPYLIRPSGYTDYLQHSRKIVQQVSASGDVVLWFFVLCWLFALSSLIRVLRCNVLCWQFAKSHLLQWLDEPRMSFGKPYIVVFFKEAKFHWCSSAQRLCLLSPYLRCIREVLRSAENCLSRKDTAQCSHLFYLSDLQCLRQQQGLSLFIKYCLMHNSLQKELKGITCPEQGQCSHLFYLGGFLSKQYMY